jgi:Tfp pilus assembly protein PilX
MAAILSRWFRRFPWCAGLRGRNRGSTLLGVVILITIISVLFMTLMQTAGQEAALAKKAEERSRALFLAESGVGFAKSWLEAQPSPPTGTAHVYPLGGTPDTLASGSYHAKLVPWSTNVTEDKKTYTIVALGTAGNATRNLEVDITQQSWANVLYYTNREHTPGNQPCWFMTGEHLEGPVRSNDEIRIWGNPTFGGPVQSSANRFVYYNNHPHHHVRSSEPSNPPHDIPTFEQGYELGATLLSLPNNLSYLNESAEDAGLVISGGAEIVLSRIDDGGQPMYGYVSYSTGKNWTDVPISSFNGIVYVDGEVELSGVLDGELTIVSSENMKIMDDILYRDRNENGPTPYCDDLLGLVSGANIIIWDSAANANDCEIHAHMICPDGVLRAKRWNSLGPTGTLRIRGGIVQKMRGPVGRVEIVGGELVLVSGYRKDYRYDDRLAWSRPPGYGFLDMSTPGFAYTRLAWREITAG